jgi:hypothetical protein
MLDKTHILVEWMLQHNHLWAELDSVTKISKDYSEDTELLIEPNSAEMKSTLRRNGTWYSSCPLLVDGDLFYFDNESFCDEQDYIESRKNVVNWLLKNKLDITDAGISVKHNPRYCGKIKSAARCDAENVPGLKGWYSSRDVMEPNKHTKHLGNVIKNSAVIIRNTSLFVGPGGRDMYECLIQYVAGINEEKQRNTITTYLAEQVDDIRLLANNALACKFNEVDDFVYVGEPWIKDRGLHTLKNFPNVVRGNLVFERSCFIKDWSDFPKVVKGSVYFADGGFDEDIIFPNGVTINGNFNFEGRNSHFMLIALAMSDVQIGGVINSPLFCGRIETLRDIAVKQKWFESYEKLNKKGSNRRNS